MVYIRKEFAYIALEDPALSGVVLVPVFGEKAFEPVKAKVEALALLGCVAVQYKAVGDAIIEQVVHYGVLDQLVYKGRGLYQPFLGLKDIEHLKSARPVYLGAQDVNEVYNVLQQPDLKTGGCCPCSLASPCGQIGFVEHGKRADL